MCVRSIVSEHALVLRVINLEVVIFLGSRMVSAVSWLAIAIARESTTTIALQLALL